jgi:TonB family protein
VAPAEAPRVAIAAVVVDGPSASWIAAETLAELFCGPGACEPQRAALWQARAEARQRAIDAELEAQHAALRAARVVALDRDDWTRLREVGELDAAPRPIGKTRLDFPRRLRRQEVDGRIVLLLELSGSGEVVDVHVDDSDLPEFESFVANQVRGWRFTPPTENGRPVRARARLPIPIRIN